MEKTGSMGHMPPSHQKYFHNSRMWIYTIFSYMLAENPLLDEIFHWFMPEILWNFEKNWCKLDEIMRNKKPDTQSASTGDSPKSVNFQLVKNDFLKVIFSIFSPLKSIAQVSRRPKMQFSPIHTQSGGMQSILKFQWQDRWNSIGLVLEKSVRSMEF